MSALEKLLCLQAPADGEGSATGTGGTSTTDAGQKQDAEGEKKVETKAAGEGERKSVLKAATETKQEGEKKLDAKDAEAKAKDGAADAYEVKVPEGIEVDKDLLAKFASTAKELGISAEAASKLVAFDAERLKAASEAQAKSWAKQGDDWYGALEKDSEFGGANLPASTAALQTALTRFDPKGELVADLSKYGIENLPSLAKFLRRVGIAGAEDKARLTTAPVKAQDPEQARVAKRYPSIKGIQPT